MAPTRRRLVVGGVAAAAIAGVLVWWWWLGTGADPGRTAPDDASTAAFCTTWRSVVGTIPPDLSAASAQRQFATDLVDFGDELERVGTPTDISDDERAGFELTVEALQDATAGEVADRTLIAGLDADDQRRVRAFEDYANDGCAVEFHL